MSLHASFPGAKHVEAMKDEKHHFLFLFFAYILKEDWMPQQLKQEWEDEKLQLRQDVRIHINTPLLEMPLMASSSDKEGNLSA